MDPKETNTDNSVRDTLVILIGNLLARYKGSKNDNTKEVLMLIAALNLIDIAGESENKQLLSVARRLISGAK
jgi:hypothetical protein